MDGEQWLAACHPNPEQVYEQWEEPPHLAVLPTGVRFDVLRLPQPFALAVLWELGDQAQKIPVLEEHVQPRPVFYLLAEPGTLDGLSAGDSTVLTVGDEFTVPSPGADGITGVQRHSFLWRTAPDGGGQLADADELRTACEHARDSDRQAARVRAARSVFWGAKHTRRS
ncbi:hypothetical protein [Streptomyces sp. KL116D]|uniref:hypothetical protein n=1 Tax=Streptomyces sp. KL116D TaxID=3045152 RepID=UPI003555C339